MPDASSWIFVPFLRSSLTCSRPGRSGRFSLDKVCRNAYFDALLMGLFHCKCKRLKGPSPYLYTGRANGRQRRLGEARESNVVKTHDRNVLRDAQPGRFELLHCTERHQVVCDNYRRRQLRFREYLMRGVPSALKAKIPLIDLYVGLGKMPFHCISKRPLSNAGRMDLVRARDVNDLAVAERNKMTDRVVDPDGVVKNDVAHLFANDTKIVKDDARFLVLEFVDQRLVKLGDHQNDAGNFHLQETPDVFDSPFGLVIRV